MDCNLLKQLLTKKELEFVADLVSEKDEYVNSACQFAGQKLQSSKNLVYGNMFSMIYYICSTAKFTTPNECYKVSQIIYNFHNVREPLPLISEHKGIDLAERIFISLCFYSKQLQHRSKFNNYPSIEYYREVCYELFLASNNKDIASNLRKWELFLQERFI